MKKQNKNHGPFIKSDKQDDNILSGMGVSLRAIIDKYKPNKDGLFPIRIRIIHNLKYKQYATGLFLSLNDFNKYASGRGKNDQVRIIISRKLEYAYQVIISLEAFTFESFENKYYNKNNWNNVSFAFITYIEDLHNKGKVGTASSCECSRNSLIDYCKSKNINFDILKFDDITVRFLKCYQSFMQQPYDVVHKLKNNKTKVITKPPRSLTTIGIYLRALRSIFNAAIQNGVNADSYPFGVKKYTIPKGSSAKKALSKKKIQILFNGTPKTKEQQKAKDFWFLSFFCNGANIKDLLCLKFENIEGNSLTFIREKTKNTAKETKLISVFLDDFAMQVINRYSNSSTNKADYIFPILDKNDSPLTIKRKTVNFVKFINEHFKKYAISCGIDDAISTYTARHSYASLLITNNVSIQFIAEAFGHTDIRTTMQYFSGFDNATRKKVSKKLTKMIK